MTNLNDKTLQNAEKVCMRFAKIMSHDQFSSPLNGKEIALCEVKHVICI